MAWIGRGVEDDDDKRQPKTVQGVYTVDGRNPAGPGMSKSL